MSDPPSGGNNNQHGAFNGGFLRRLRVTSGQQPDLAEVAFALSLLRFDKVRQSKAAALVFHYFYPPGEEHAIDSVDGWPRDLLFYHAIDYPGVHEVVRQRCERGRAAQSAKRAKNPHSSAKFPFLAERYGNETTLSGSRRCPVCNHDSWCVIYGVVRDPAAALCMRESDGAVRSISFGGGEVGHIHELPGGLFPAQRRQCETTGTAGASAELDARPQYTVTEWEARQAACLAAMGEMRGEYAALALRLGVSAESLMAYGVGYSAEHGGYSVPMYTAAGHICGIHIRGRYSKFCATGSQLGIFAPTGALALPPPGGQLVVAEGMSDAATLRDWGFAAIGRPMATGGVNIILALAKRLKLEKVVIVADVDADGIGAQGADALALQIAQCGIASRVVEPESGKDIREWHSLGATAADMQRLLTEPPRTRVTTTRRSTR